MNDFPISDKSGAEVLALLLDNDRKRVAKGKPAHIRADGIKFTRAEWALVLPWRVALQSAFEAGLSGVDLLRTVLSGPTDGEAWADIQNRRK